MLKVLRRCKSSSAFDANQISFENSMSPFGINIEMWHELYVAIVANYALTIHPKVQVNGVSSLYQNASICRLKT